MKKIISNFIPSVLIGGFVFIFFAVVVLSCGTKDSYFIWTDSVIGVISAAVFTSQPAPGGRNSNLRKFDGLPNSSVHCPLITNTDSSLSSCSDLQNDQIVDSPGRYLRRYFGLCQFQGLQQAPWWRTFHIIRFPDATSCNTIKNSSDGLTSANIVLANLVDTNPTLNITYGLYPNGDEQNMVFSQDGNVQFLWTDFSTGFVEPKRGGVDVTFTSSVDRSIFIKGIQVKNFSPNNGQYETPLEFYLDIKNHSVSKVLTLISDRTIASIQNGDRTYERLDASLDFHYGQDYPMVVKFSGSTPVVTQGAKLRTQFNYRGAMGVSTVTEDLRYTDPTCCWPTSGKISTVFNELYTLPVVRQKSFNLEEVEFTSTCGQVVLSQSGAAAGDSVGSRTVQFYQCF